MAPAPRRRHSTGISARLLSRRSPAAPGHAALLSLPPSDRRRRVGRNVRDRTQPVARRPARWRPYSLFGVSKIAPLGFPRRRVRARPACQVLLGRLAASGRSAVANQPASADSEASGNFHWAQVVRGLCNCNVRAGVQHQRPSPALPAGRNGRTCATSSARRGTQAAHFMRDHVRRLLPGK